MSQITLDEDYARGAGWVELSVSPPVGPEVTQVTIVRRQSDKPYLGANGWQAQPVALVAEVRSDSDMHTSFHFGGAVTDYLTVDQDVTITLPQAQIKERHFWPAIAPAPKGSGGHIGVPVDTPPPPADITGPGREQPPEPEPPEEPDDAEEEPSRDDPPLEKPQKDGLRWWWLLLLLVLLILAAGAIWYFYFSDEPAPPPAPTLPPAVSEPTLFERFETYRDEGEHAEDLFDLGGEALEAGEAELAFQATILASDRDSADAHMQTGRWYDPATTDETPVSANADAAARYYGKARDAGSSEAAPALSVLCDNALEALPDEPAALLDETYDIYCQ